MIITRLGGTKEDREEMTWRQIRDLHFQLVAIIDELVARRLVTVAAVKKRYDKYQDKLKRMRERKSG